MSAYVRRQTRAVVLVAALGVALGGWQPFRVADPDVAAGNDAYAAGRFDEAIAAYERAAERGAVDPDGLAYDRGTAELAAADKLGDPAARQAMTAQAMEHLKQAAHAEDAQVRGAAHYNTGNALLGADKLDDAIDAYKDALREDPMQEDARLNLEVALRRKQKQRGGGQGSGQGQPGQPGQGQGSGAGSAQPQQGSGAGSGQPQQGSGQGQPQLAPPGPQGQGSDANHAGKPQHGGKGAHGGESPRTPTDRKLDDLEDYSRRLQRDEARRHATGHAPDPDHDW